MSNPGENNDVKAAASGAVSGDLSASRHHGREGQPRDQALPSTERRRPVVPLVSHTVIEGLARLSDVLLTTLIGSFLFHLYVQDTDLALPYYSAVVLAAFMTVLVFQLSGLYRLPVMNSITMQLSRTALAWTGVFGTLMLAAFLLKMSEDYSRLWFVGWFFLGFLSIISVRFILMGRIRGWMKEGRLERRVVIVGGGKRGQQLIEALKVSAGPDIRICGVFDDRNDDRSPEEIAGYPKLGTVSELVRFARSNRVDLLIMALPMSAEKRVLDMMRKLWVLPVDIRLSAHDAALRMTSGTYSYVGNVPFFNLYDKPLQDWDHVLKAIEDRVLAALFLVLLSPLLLLIAIIIKLDSKGPVFFKQRRYGFNNELIEVYKFRTLKHENTDANAAKLVTSDDDRVTRVGRFLRRASFDELPQFLTVLKGDMSIVGPRPHAILAKAADELYGDVVDGYFARHRVKPGITGWAQVNGWRGETDTHEKILRRTEFDLYYIENWSLLFDLYIILRTPISMLRGENAF